MQKIRDKTFISMPYVHLAPDLMEALEYEAIKRHLVPTKINRGQNPLRLGVAALIRELLEESEE